MKRPYWILIVSCFFVLSAGGASYAQLAPSRTDKAELDGDGKDRKLADDGNIDDGNVPIIIDLIDEIKPVDCESTNQALLISVGITTLLGVSLFFLFFWIFSNKNWLPGGFIRFISVLTPLVITAGVIQAVFRPEEEMVTRCILDPKLRDLILLYNIPDWQRGALFGASPVLVLSFIIKIIHGLIRRR
ncbi:hypothetical protein KJ940_17280 [Myxococcota bacterium]|nr:hypothetical protein [Myxococcota bacterium]